MNEPTYSNPLLNRDALLRAISECRMDLVIIQERLGTPDELAHDVDRASEIVHRINNLTAALALLPPHHTPGMSGR